MRIEDLPGLANLSGYRLEEWYRVDIPIKGAKQKSEYFTDYGLAELRLESQELGRSSIHSLFVFVNFVTEDKELKKKKREGFIVEGDKIEKVELSDEEKIKKEMQKSAMKKLNQADRHALRFIDTQHGVTFPALSAEIFAR